MATKRSIRRPVTYEYEKVMGKRERRKVVGGTELQQSVADLIDTLAADHPYGLRGALTEFLNGDLRANFDQTIAPSVRLEAKNWTARHNFFSTLCHRNQVEIPIIIHSLGLSLSQPPESIALCAVFATAHYLGTINGFELPRPDFEALVKAASRRSK